MSSTGCCCCQHVSSIAKLRCFAVSVGAVHGDSTVSVVGAVHNDSTVSVVGFEGQSKRWWVFMRRMTTVVAMVVRCPVDSIHVLTKDSAVTVNSTGRTHTRERAIRQKNNHILIG